MSCDRFDHDAGAPVDPNIKLVGAARFIQPDQRLVYATHFENTGDIEARDIFITDTLDADLDVSSLHVYTRHLDPVALPLDTNVTLFEQEKVRVIEVDGQTIEIPVTETWIARLDSATRTVTWNSATSTCRPASPTL